MESATVRIGKLEPGERVYNMNTAVTGRTHNYFTRRA